MADEVWIGLANLQPDPTNDSLGDAAGAHVHVVACAASRESFVLKVEAAAREFHFALRGVDEVRRFDPMENFGELDLEIREITDRVREDGYARFGTFFTYSALN